MEHEAVVLLGLVDPAAGAQEAPAELQIETIELRDNLYVLLWPRHKTATVFVAEEGLLLIDNHYLREAPEIDRALKAISDLPVRYLVNTHWHLDHVASNGWWAEEATIIAHRKARLRMSGSDLLGGRKLKTPLEEYALPKVTFEDRLTLHFGGQEIQLIHFPNAHTDSDCVVWFPGLEVCVTGDIFYPETFPFVDLDGGGDPRGMREAVRQLGELLPETTTLVPGHGTVSTLPVLEEFGEMLEKTIELVAIDFERGKTTHDMDVGGTLIDYESRWGGEENRILPGYLKMLDKYLHPK